MSVTKYYTLGSRSEKEGLTVMTALFDEDGKPLIAYPFESLYKLKEITEDEYLAIRKEMLSPAIGRLGIAGGLIDKDGLAEIVAMEDQIIKDVDEMNQKKADIFFKRAMKMEELGISTVEDEILLIQPSKGVSEKIAEMVSKN